MTARTEEAPTTFVDLPDEVIRLVAARLPPARKPTWKAAGSATLARMAHTCRAVRKALADGGVRCEVIGNDPTVPPFFTISNFEDLHVYDGNWMPNIWPHLERASVTFYPGAPTMAQIAAAAPNLRRLQADLPGAQTWQQPTLAHLCKLDVTTWRDFAPACLAGLPALESLGVLDMIPAPTWERTGTFRALRKLKLHAHRTDAGLDMVLYMVRNAPRLEYAEANVRADGTRAIVHAHLESATLARRIRCDHEAFSRTDTLLFPPNLPSLELMSLRRAPSDEPRIVAPGLQRLAVHYQAGTLAGLRLETEGALRTLASALWPKLGRGASRDLHGITTLEITDPDAFIPKKPRLEMFPRLQIIAVGADLVEEVRRVVPAHIAVHRSRV